MNEFPPPEDEAWRSLEPQYARQRVSWSGLVPEFGVPHAWRSPQEFSVMGVILDGDPILPAPPKPIEWGQITWSAHA